MTKKRKNNAKIASLNDVTKYDVMLPNYSLLSITFRIIFSFLVTVIIIQLVANSLESENPIRTINAFTYIRTALTFLLFGEVLILIDFLLERFLPFPANIRKRFLLQLLLSILTIIIYFNISLLITPQEKSVPTYVTYFALGMGFTFVILYSSSLLVTRMTQRWVLSQTQIEKMNQEKIKMDYDALQEQLNPDFLFNNLSVLKSLIIFDKDAATKFTDNFTDVYRYALQSKKESLVPLSKELEFIESYIALHKERLGESINIILKLNNISKERKIVPRTLQLLIENAIRHNVVDEKFPLQITIYTKNDELNIENKITLKKTGYTSKKGLAKLQNHYKFLAGKEVRILNEGNNFKVIVPLL